MIGHRFGKRRARVAWFGAVLAMALTGGAAPRDSLAQAAAYPNKPVRLVVPFAAGGTPDIIAREFAQGLGGFLGQPVVVDNRGGAGGIIGADAVAKSPPDGYTLVLGSDSTLVNAAFFAEKMPYDALRDFAPIAMIASFPLALVANPDTGIKTLAQYVAYAKARPGAVSYATVGQGSSHHISMTMLSQMAGLQLIHVPYKGGAPALADVLAGHIPAMFSGVGTAMSHIKAGKLNVIAMSGSERFFQLPDVPTVAELGYPGFDVTNWTGILAPAGTPAPILARLEADIFKVTRSDAYKARLGREGIESLTRSGEVFGKRIRADMEKNAAALRAAGVIK